MLTTIQVLFLTDIVTPVIWSQLRVTIVEFHHCTQHVLFLKGLITTIFSGFKWITREHQYSPNHYDLWKNFKFFCLEISLKNFKTTKALEFTISPCSLPVFYDHMWNTSYHGAAMITIFSIIKVNIHQDKASCLFLGCVNLHRRGITKETRVLVSPEN